MGFLGNIKNQCVRFIMNIKGDLNDSKIVKTTFGLAGAGCATASAYNFGKKEASPRAGTVSGLFSLVFLVLFFFMENEDDKRKEREYDQEREKKREEEDNYRNRRDIDGDYYRRNREADADCYRRNREADAACYRSKRETDAQYKKDSRQQSEEKCEEEAEPWQGYSYEEVADDDNNDIDWIVEGLVARQQITFLLGCAGIGKSLLQTQIALRAAKGEAMEFLPDSKPTGPLKVIYYQLERFKGELKGKYGRGGIFKDTENFTFAAEQPHNVDSLLKDIRKCLNTLTGDTLICIDPASKLDGYMISIEKLIKGLEEIQRLASERNIELSFLVSSHVEEIPEWKPLRSDNIVGGDKLIQQAGAVFAIRKEKSSNDARFIQTLKAPKGSVGIDRAIVCKLGTTLVYGNPYPHFVFQEMKKEEDALPTKSKAANDDGDEKRNIRNPNIKWDDEMIHIIKDKRELPLKKIAEMLTIYYQREYGTDQKIHDEQVARKAKDLGL